MAYPFTYTVQIYDNDIHEYYLENGISLCNSYKDAADILEQYYGNTLIAIKHLELFEETQVITLPKDTFDEITECLESYNNFAIKCDEKGMI